MIATTIQRKAYLVPPYTEMAMVLRPAESEHFALKSFTVTDEEAKHQRIMGMFEHLGSWLWRDFTAGTYMGLYPKQTTPWRNDPIMSDTPYERRTCLEVVKAAHGDVLIAGLGIGMILIPILQRDDVVSVTVLEKEREVVDLVEPQLQVYLGDTANKLTVYVADAFTWEPRFKGAKYDTIWFDIWPTLNGDNWAEMKALHRRYRKWWNHDGFMGSWERDVCRSEARK